MIIGCCPWPFPLMAASWPAGSADRTIRLWNIQSGRTDRVLRGYKNWVTSVVFSPDGDLVAGGGYDRRDPPLGRAAAAAWSTRCAAR